jgi:ABC-2 type transport system permease protein
MTGLKLQALVSHNFRLAWSHKLNFFSRYLAVVVSVLLFYFLDQLLQLSGQAAFDGGSYFTFVLIGGVFVRFLELGGHAFSANLRDEMLMGTIEPLLVTATPITLSVLAPSSWMLLQGILLVIAQILIGALLGADFSRANWGSAIVVLLISMTSLISYGIISAAFVIVFKRSDPINWFINSIAY